MRVVRLFVSSPGDVAPERARAQAVAAKLNLAYQGLVTFETVLWEERFYKADASFQPQIVQSTACDIVVSIFWTRIGTELPAEFARMPDGRPYASGTVYELLTALAASKGAGVPDVYVFRKTADAPMPTADAERRRQAQSQLDALEAFWSEWFRSQEGQFKAAYHSFADTDAFEVQLEQLLRQWLETHGVLGPRLGWPKDKGSPFRGLASFESEHAAVFFGRDRIIDVARRRLEAAATRGTPFLLIVGASGAGKSSLARAGLIPRLMTPGMVASVDLWRVARMRPSDGGAGPLLALASALIAAGALPELAQGDYPDAAALADNLARGGAAASAGGARARSHRRGGAAATSQRAAAADGIGVAGRSTRGTVRAGRRRGRARRLCGEPAHDDRHRRRLVHRDPARRCLRSDVERAGARGSQAGGRESRSWTARCSRDGRDRAGAGGGSRPRVGA
jgi:hypothetical protein